LRPSGRRPEGRGRAGGGCGPADGIGPTDRWIDVDIERQVLVAYEGTTPMFATLVSPGRNNKHSETPTGIFEFWVKLDYTDVADIERTDIPKN